MGQTRAFLRWGPLLLIAVLVGAGLLMAGDPARSGDGFVEPPVGEAQETGDLGVEDHTEGPTTARGGQETASLAAAVTTLESDYGMVLAEESSVGVGADSARVLALTGEDGALISVVFQHLTEPLPVDAVGSPDVVSAKLGPTGQDLIVKDLGVILQVVAVDPTGRMVNIIVDKTTVAGASSEASPDLETVEAWAIDLLTRSEAEGW